MNPTIISGAISGLSGLLGAIFLAVAIWTRRLSREARELRTLREVNRAAFSYIYLLEIASDRLQQETGRKIKIEKPKELQLDYLIARADEGNKEMEAVTELARKLTKLPPLDGPKE